MLETFHASKLNYLPTIKQHRKYNLREDAIFYLTANKWYIKYRKQNTQEIDDALKLGMNATYLAVRRPAKKNRQNTW